MSQAMKRLTVTAVTYGDAMASAPNMTSRIPQTIDQMEACRSDTNEVCAVMFPPHDIRSGTFCTWRPDYARSDFLPEAISLPQPRLPAVRLFWPAPLERRRQGKGQAPRDTSLITANRLCSESRKKPI